MKKFSKLILLTTAVVFILITTTACNSTVHQQKEFVGSCNSNIYHYLNCVWAQKINSNNSVYFSSVEDAQNSGYRACNVCHPPE